MKKLFKSLGFAVVIAVIALNALFITGCPDVGGDDPVNTQKDTPTTPPHNPSLPTAPPAHGGTKTIELGANQWETSGHLTGYNWSSGDQIKLSDFAGIKLKKNGTYTFRVRGTSDVPLTRINLQFFSGSTISDENNRIWLGTSYDSAKRLINLGQDFNELFEVKIENDPTPDTPIFIQFNNIMWQKNELGTDLYNENLETPSDYEKGKIMATITNFSINLDNVDFGKAPELCTDEERWWAYVDGTSTATLASQYTEGIMIAVVGGTAMLNVQDNWNAWKARVGYYYTADANAQYTFKFEAWTLSGTRNLHLQYYENNSTSTYLGKDVPITTTRKTYEVISESIPTSGLEILRFQLADQLGTVFIKIIKIEKYVFDGGTLTVSNFSGEHGLVQDAYLEGSTNYYHDGIGLVFGSTADKYSDDEGGWHWFGKEIQIKNDPINIYVWEVNYNTNTSAPFKGTKTIPVGELELQQSHFDRPGNNWLGDDYYYNKVPITFTNGNASINFGTQMEYDGTWIPGENGGEGHYVSPYQITVTGVSGKIGHASLNVFSAPYSYRGQVLSGGENISGNSVTINLRKNNEADSPFTGSGYYYLSIWFDNNGNSEEYYYTNGQEFTSLDITQDSDFHEHYDRLPKYNITSIPFTIDLSKFRKRPEPQEWYDSNRITTITITNTGITEYRGGYLTLMGSNDYYHSLNNKFSNGTLTSYFLDVESGSYSLRLNFYGEGGGEEYAYTGGQTLDQLGITSQSDLYKLPTYPNTISSGATISINFSQFKKLPKPYEWYSSYKTITITGLDDWGDFYLIGVNQYYHPIYSTNSWIGDSRTTTTYWVDFENHPGNYYLLCRVSHYDGSSWVDEQYVYTDGSTLASLGINSTDDFDKLPIFNVQTMPNTTTIDFSKFQRVPDSWLH